jgi:hypothetical protein
MRLINLKKTKSKLSFLKKLRGWLTDYETAQKNYLDGILQLESGEIDQLQFDKLHEKYETCKESIRHF